MELNVNRIIDQLCAANCTNGELSAEVEFLTKKCEELTEELTKTKKALEVAAEEAEKYESLWQYSYRQEDAMRKELKALKGEADDNKGDEPIPF